jgi:hypothetical protein
MKFAVEIIIRNLISNTYFPRNQIFLIRSWKKRLTGEIRTIKWITHGSPGNNGQN